MIHVLAKAPVRPGCMHAALACYRRLVPLILAAEPGCLAYQPSLDLDQGLHNQELAADEILVIERWQSLDDFQRHLRMPHCIAFRQEIMPCLRGGITVRILQDALSVPELPDESHEDG